MHSFSDGDPSLSKDSNIVQRIIMYIQNSETEELIDFYNKGWRLHHRVSIEECFWLHYVLKHKSGLILSNIITLDEDSLLHNDCYKHILAVPCYINNIIEVYKSNYVIIVKNELILDFIIKLEHKATTIKLKQQYEKLSSIFKLEDSINK